MWGNIRDLKIIERLEKIEKVKSIVNDNQRGMGLIQDKIAKKVGNNHLKDHYFLDTKQLCIYYTNKKNLLKLKKEGDRFRTNLKDIFDPPLLLFKEGANENLSTTYIDYKCVYKSSILGIKFNQDQTEFVKALVACFNSTLASYYYFLTSSSWGVDRKRVQKNEALLFPAIPKVLSTEIIELLATKVNNIISLENQFNFNSEKDIQEIQNQIDDIIYKQLKLSETEINLINDTLNYSVSLRKRYKLSGAERFNKHKI